MKKVLLLISVISIFLTSCHTIRGMGQDLSRLGQGVSNTAEGKTF